MKAQTKSLKMCLSVAKIDVFVSYLSRASQRNILIFCLLCFIAFSFLFNYHRPIKLPPDSQLNKKTTTSKNFLSRAKSSSYVSSSELTSSVKSDEYRFNDSRFGRIARLRDVCEKSHGGQALIRQRKNQSNKVVKDGKEVDQSCPRNRCTFLVDMKRNILFAFIPKVASSTIKAFFLKAADLKEFESKFPANSSHTPGFHTYANKKLMRVSATYFTSEELKAFYKMIIVRHPFERLVSAYRDKALEPNKRGFYKSYFNAVMRQTRNGTIITKLSILTFPEFVWMLLKTDPYRMDVHWMPYWARVEPCWIQYDFIGKMETIEDLNEVKKKLRLFDKNQIWKNRSNSSTSQVAKKFFSQIKRADVMKLYDIYYPDFQLFGYSVDGYL